MKFGQIVVVVKESLDTLVDSGLISATTGEADFANIVNDVKAAELVEVVLVRHGVAIPGKAAAILEALPLLAKALGL